MFSLLSDNSKTGVFGKMDSFGKKKIPLDSFGNLWKDFFSFIWIFGATLEEIFIKIVTKDY